MSALPDDLAKVRSETTRKAVLELRKRLLDLSNRNRLLNYKHRETARQVRLVNTSLNYIYTALASGNGLRFMGLPAPNKTQDEAEFESALAVARLTDEEYLNAVSSLDDEGDKANDVAESALVAKVRAQLGLEPVERAKRTAEQVAKALGIATTFDLAVDADTNAALQALLFEEQLERKLSAVRDEALSSLQERGVNTLYCALGFLEWYESDDSAKVLQSPLLLMPISLERHVEYSRYAYSAKGVDEEIETNVTLAERLFADFKISMPAFDPEAALSQYFRDVELAILPQKRWRIRTFATVGLFDFTRLAMYKDLDPTRRTAHNALEEQPTLLDLLGGVVESNASDSGQRWSDDVHHANAPLMVTDADSSQFAALLESLNGKSFVIEGPPGTGKSQTITNMIAALLAAGKTILFVADKLAALEVVKNRLDAARLGDFCMELHSTKLQKTEVYTSIRRRINLTREPPVQETIFADIAAEKAKIGNYVSALHTQVGQLGMSVHELIWLEQRLRVQLGDAVQQLQSICLPNALRLSRHELADLKSLLSSIAERSNAYVANYGSVMLHPLAAIVNGSLNPRNTGLLQAAVQAFIECGRRIPRILSEVGIHSATDDTTYGFVSDLTTAIGKLGSISPTPTSGGVERVKSIEQLDPAIELGEMLLQNAKSRQQWPDGLYDQVSRDPTSFSSLLSSLKQHGLSGRKEIVSATDEQRARVNDLRDAAATIDAISATVPWQPSRSRPSLDCLAAVVMAFRSVERALVAEHGGRIVRLPPIATIEECAAAAKAVALNRKAQAARFDTTLVESTAHIRRHAASLRDSNLFSSMLSKEFREAKSFYRRVSLVQDSVGTKHMAERLLELAVALDEEATFAQNKKFLSLLGGAFKGLQTDFVSLTAAASFAATVRETLALHGEAGIDLEARIAALTSDQAVSLRAIAVRPEAAALANFCRSVPTNLSLSDAFTSAEVAVGELQCLLEAFDSFHPQGTLALEDLLAIDRHVAESSNLRWRIEATPELRNLFAYAKSEYDLTSRLSGLRYWSILRNLDIEMLVGEIDPDTLLTSHASRELRETFARMDQACHELATVAGLDLNRLARGPIAEAPFGAVLEAMSGIAQHLSDLPDWLQYRRAIGSAIEKGCAAILDTNLGTTVSPADALEYVVARSLILEACAQDSQLLDSVGLDLTKSRHSFQQLDRRLLRENQARLKNLLLRRPIDSGNRVGNRGSWTGKSLIENEAGKKSRHVAIRELHRRAGRALQQLKPCFMMSPLSVAQFIEPGSMHFDVLIIDEASQMRPEDALGAVARASQIVIVGDPKQLPPTAFFDRSTTTDDIPDEDSVETESILDLAMQQYGKPRRLLWHYRSRHDSLIAFSNKHFYDNELQVFPSPDQTGELGVRYKHVGGRYQGSVNPVEAIRIAERAIELMRATPNLSMGIVSMNQRQRDLIRLEFESRLLLDKAAQRYVEDWEERLEPFIIKNLETIQGDERDIILISTVYGPDASGNVFQRFGPINSRNGWRRLNVLFTRAKSRIEVLSSLRPGDIVFDERTGRGLRAFRDYLDYASSGRLETGWLTSRSPDSDFEVAVAAMLRDRGYDCVPQVGVAGFFIDIGVRDPKNSGRFVLGIECDGSTYHSSKAARDRDRLRDEVLTRLGWRLHRVWSTDWFAEPHRQIDRIVSAINVEVGNRSAAADHAAGPSPTLSGASVDTQVQVTADAALVVDVAAKTEKATSVDDLLLESDILEALRGILPAGTSLEREKLLRSLAAAVKKPLNRKLRSAFNTMISREVKSGHLLVDASWLIVRRP